MSEINSTIPTSNLKIPSQIQINNFLYSFKDKLAHSKYSYRCSDRKNCNTAIHVLKPEIENYIKNHLYNIIVDKQLKDHSLNC